MQREKESHRTHRSNPFPQTTLNWIIGTLSFLKYPWATSLQGTSGVQGGLSYTLLCDFCYLTVSSYLFTLEANTNSSSCHTQSSLALICHVLPSNSYSEPKFSLPDPMSVFPVQTFWRGILMTVIKISFTLGCKEVKSLCPGLIAKKRRTGLWMQICLSKAQDIFITPSQLSMNIKGCCVTSESRLEKAMRLPLLWGTRSGSLQLPYKRQWLCCGCHVEKSHGDRCLRSSSSSGSSQSRHQTPRSHILTSMRDPEWALPCWAKSNPSLSWYKDTKFGVLWYTAIDN